VSLQALVMFMKNLSIDRLWIGIEKSDRDMRNKGFIASMVHRGMEGWNDGCKHKHQALDRGKINEKKTARGEECWCPQALVRAHRTSARTNTHTNHTHMHFGRAS
jgi:hypothetical protein